MNFCKDCKHMTGLATCSHPNNGICLIDGEPKPKFCIVNRNSEALCGENGNWFELKEKQKPKTWRKIWW